MIAELTIVCTAVRADPLLLLMPTYCSLQKSKMIYNTDDAKCRRGRAAGVAHAAQPVSAAHETSANGLGLWLAAQETASESNGQDRLSRACLRVCV